MHVLLCPQAEEFRTAVHMLLEWLSEAEQSLRFRGALPDDAEALQSLIDVHKVTGSSGSQRGAALRVKGRCQEHGAALCLLFLEQPEQNL